MYRSLRRSKLALSTTPPNCRGTRMSMLCYQKLLIVFVKGVITSKFSSIHDNFNHIQILKKFLTVNSKQQQSKMFTKSEAPAAERNKEPILNVLKQLVKVSEGGDFPDVKILEIASGTGQHITHFAKNMSPTIFWQPTEYDTASFSSICAYIQENKLKNVAPPVFVDIREPYHKWNPTCGEAELSVTKLKPITKFEEESFDYIYNSNLIHISSFDCTEGLFFNSGKLLKKKGCLITYGPYAQNGILKPQSNIDFDAGLRASNPAWGVRDIQLQLTPLARKNNMDLVGALSMPSNNKILIWQKV